MVGAVEPLRPLCAGTSESAIAAAIESAFCGQRIFHKRRTGNAEKAVVSLPSSICTRRFSNFRSSSSAQQSAETRSRRRERTGSDGRADARASSGTLCTAVLIGIRIFQTRPVFQQFAGAGEPACPYESCTESAGG